MVKLDVHTILPSHAIRSEAGIILSLFLFFGVFEPRCSDEIVLIKSISIAAEKINTLQLTKTGSDDVFTQNRLFIIFITFIIKRSDEFQTSLYFLFSSQFVHKVEANVLDSILEFNTCS